VDVAAAGVEAAAGISGSKPRALQTFFWVALLYKSCSDRISLLPGRIYAGALVTGTPRAVERLSTAIRAGHSATLLIELSGHETLDRELDAVHPCLCATSPVISGQPSLQAWPSYLQACNASFSRGGTYGIKRYQVSAVVHFCARDDGCGTGY